MADLLDLSGDYGEDIANIRQMFQDLVERSNVDNWEGTEITHQFSSTVDESIPHKLERVPRRVIPVKVEGAAGAYEFISATKTEIVLKANDAALKLSFYLE